MSDDRRLRRPKEYAREHFPRDREGRFIAPFVRRKRPRAGDVHPLDTWALRALLLRQPLEHLYGLKGVELLPRRGAIGEPFGVYRPAEKLIRLYSVPKIWPVAGRSRAAFWIKLGATYEEDREGARVVWKKSGDLAYWYYIGVLLHELGHHYSFQWRRKRKTPRAISTHERLADMRAIRSYKRFRVQFTS
jgi:hypothetical protein